MKVREHVEHLRIGACGSSRRPVCRPSAEGIHPGGAQSVRGSKSKACEGERFGGDGKGSEGDNVPGKLDAPIGEVGPVGGLWECGVAQGLSENDDVD